MNAKSSMAMYVRYMPHAKIQSVHSNAIANRVSDWLQMLEAVKVI